jgi:hypothetical protein
MAFPITAISNSHSPWRVVLSVQQLYFEDAIISVRRRYFRGLTRSRGPAADAAERLSHQKRVLDDFIEVLRTLPRAGHSSGHR